MRKRLTSYLELSVLGRKWKRKRHDFPSWFVRKLGNREKLVFWRRIAILPFHSHRHGIPSTEAQRGNASLGVASNHFVEQRG